MSISKTQHVAVILVTFALVAGGVYVLVGWLNDSGHNTDRLQKDGPQWGAVELATPSASGTSPSERGRREEGVDDGTAQVGFDNPRTFEHPERGFVFEYPGNLSIGRFDERGGETIVVQNASERVGFQVHIVPFDEAIDITPERIRADLPELEVRDPQPVQLSGSARQGLAFLSNNESFGGNSREVWFTFGGHLYQISTYASLDPLLKHVLASWEFRGAQNM